ncbi:hypothetical protein CEXT_443181 [Caerostris extrusa]|uniref:Uncharacterized protein n=1 Tax=Caerostris extrusa TaxID=172846 RepID=A0AAV4YBM3_CAEEX|nr:hypothetical protein CEXT_443181 [Caerostris extrusa]
MQVLQPALRPIATTMFVRSKKVKATSTTWQIAVNPSTFSILKIPNLEDMGAQDNTKSEFFLLPAITRIAITGRLSRRKGVVKRDRGLQSEKPWELIGKSFFSTPPSSKLLFSDEVSM